MSRTMQTKEKAPARRSGTPIWVWLIYGIGVFAAAILVFSVLFTAGAFLLSNDVPVTLDFSAPALVLWGGLMLLAAVVFFRRRRR